MPVVSVGVTVFVLPWQPPQPELEEPVLPELLAKTPSGTASTITISIIITIARCPDFSIISPCTLEAKTLVGHVRLLSISRGAVI